MCTVAAMWLQCKPRLSNSVDNELFPSASLLSFVLLYVYIVTWFSDGHIFSVCLWPLKWKAPVSGGLQEDRPMLNILFLRFTGRGSSTRFITARKAKERRKTGKLLKFLFVFLFVFYSKAAMASSLFSWPQCYILQYIP